jgi:hypothetical protein
MQFLSGAPWADKMADFRKGENANFYLAPYADKMAD